MKKHILLNILLFFFLAVLNAAPVDEARALQTAKNFLMKSPLALEFDLGNLKLLHRENAGSAGIASSGASAVYYYVFGDNDGFIIISGDDLVRPVLAYSSESVFDYKNMPYNARKWMEDIKSQIRYAQINLSSAAEEVKAEWDGTYSNPGTGAKRAAVSPLVQTRWNQSPYYNAMCPGGSVTGCVATAMAQVMKYWNYPTTGSGFHSYNHDTYGTLSANFGSTTYQWSNMPNNVSSSNSAVATLMYHCGVSVDMMYSPSSSGAYVINDASPVTNCAEYAFETYFGYKTSLQGVQRNNYSTSTWTSMLQTELNAGRPILYAGFGSGGGHAFVCDGYNSSSYFHFNWGWGGAYDGYFSIDALNPSGTGTGGGSGGYNSNHQAIIGVEPPTGGSQNFSLELYKSLNLSASTIYYGQSFSVSTNIYNKGTGNFSGDYGMAIFDKDLSFIDFVETKTGNSLNAGYVYNNDLVFQTSGNFSMLPGTYYVSLFCKPTGGNWIQLGAGSYSNLVQMNVVSSNDIEMNSSMTLNPTEFTKGQSASINLNVKNTGGSTFYGDYQLNLYTLEGDFVQTIGTITESNGLQSGYTYLSPYLTFSASSITADPGTYLLALLRKPTSSGSWQLVGSTDYLNPIKVKVKSPALQGDAYEVNNTVAQSYNLPLNFSNDQASRNTVGSNMHNGTDNDFYKISLSAGYTYSVSARIHDTYSSGNGNTYTVDAILSYSTDGVNWSEAFDDIIPGTISQIGNGTIYFQVSPYFAGETGTYLLDISVSRTAGTGLAENSVFNGLKLYPNPAKDFCSLDLTDLKETVISVKLYNSNGQVIKDLYQSEESSMYEITLTDIPAGIYFVQVETAAGIRSKKLLICK